MEDPLEADSLEDPFEADCLEDPLESHLAHLALFCDIGSKRQIGNNLIKEHMLYSLNNCVLVPAGITNLLRFKISKAHEIGN